MAPRGPLASLHLLRCGQLAALVALVTRHMDYARPHPPKALTRPGLGFARSHEVEELLREEFVRYRGIYYAAEHAHLVDATVGVVWAASVHKDRGSEKAGTAQVLAAAAPSTWGAAMQRVLLHQLFGPALPNFLITLSGPVSSTYDDRQFFALLDHELSHCAVAKDRYGAPRFNEETGLPVWGIRPHDHEGFVGTTARWGAHASGAAALVAAGNTLPNFTWVPGKDLDLYKVCGTR